MFKLFRTLLKISFVKFMEPFENKRIPSSKCYNISLFSFYKHFFVYNYLITYISLIE